MEAALEPRPVVTLGIPLHPVTMAEALGRIDDLVAARTPRYLVTANVHFAAAARRDAELQRILCAAELVLCDGTPLVWASRWLGAATPERVAGSDLLSPLLARAAERGHRVFFLGATDDTLQAARRRALGLFRGLRVCGALAPPHASLEALGVEALVDAVRAAAPDLLLVALGCPKQEKLIARHHEAMGVPCSIGVGASLDFLAGRFSRAPLWMKHAGLEWLHRLLREPSRLWPRYAEDLGFFFPCLVGQLLRHGRWRRPEPLAAPPALDGLRWYRWEGRVDARSLAAGAAPLPLPGAPGERVAVSLGAVGALDASALGALVHAWRLCREAAGALVLFAPSRAVRRELGASGLWRVLPVADDVASLRAHLSCALPQTTNGGPPCTSPR